MTKNEIKGRIAQLLKSVNYSFSSYKTREGVELKVEGEALGLEMPIYVITPEGELPAPEGDFELDNGMVVKVVDGIIKSIEPTPMEEDVVVEEGMAEATLADGTKITNKMEGEFEVGQVLYVITEDGSEQIAPQGEHSTSSGITLVVSAEDGVITGIKRPDEEGEGSLENRDNTEMEKVVEELMKVMEKMGETINELKGEQEKMRADFSKIAEAPAGEKVRDKKHGFNADLKTFDKAQAIYNLRNL